MYSEWVLGILFGMGFLWLGTLSYFTWKQTKFLEELFPKEGSRDIRKKFEETLESVASFKESLEKIKAQLLGLDQKGLGYIKKVELLRYNPYDETGGDQSFSLALLNGEGSGLVVTSLHSRAGTRVFAKPVVKGKSAGYNFSEEEEKVVKKALDG